MEQDVLKKLINETQENKVEALNELSKVLKSEVLKAKDLLRSDSGDSKGDPSVEVARDLSISRLFSLVDLVDKLTKLR